VIYQCDCTRSWSYLIWTIFKVTKRDEFKLDEVQSGVLKITVDVKSLFYQEDKNQLASSRKTKDERI